MQIDATNARDSATLARQQATTIVNEATGKAAALVHDAEARAKAIVSEAELRASAVIGESTRVRDEQQQALAAAASKAREYSLFAYFCPDSFSLSLSLSISLLQIGHTNDCT